jgi:hypothetical protein
LFALESTLLPIIAQIDSNEISLGFGTVSEINFVNQVSLVRRGTRLTWIFGTKGLLGVN